MNHHRRNKVKTLSEMLSDTDDSLRNGSGESCRAAAKELESAAGMALGSIVELLRNLHTVNTRRKDK